MSPTEALQDRAGRSARWQILDRVLQENQPRAAAEAHATKLKGKPFGDKMPGVQPTFFT